jgi:hypothetical protein
MERFEKTQRALRESSVLKVHLGNGRSDDPGELPIDSKTIGGWGLGRPFFFGVAATAADANQQTADRRPPAQAATTSGAGASEASNQAAEK